MNHRLTVLAPAPARTCVWMDAGLLAYRLCDRGFACEHCPFDAAMRRDPSAHSGDHESPDPPPSTPWDFPPDRLYTGGHLWVQVIRAGRVRIGLDACAARLLRSVRHIVLAEPNQALTPGAWLCTVVLDAGQTPLAAPISARLVSANPRLTDRPDLAVAEAYGEGWLAELALNAPAELDGLLSAAEARELADLDARQFRRQLAFRWISAAPASGDLSLAPPFLDASLAAAGAAPYLTLARRFVH